MTMKPHRILTFLSLSLSLYITILPSVTPTKNPQTKSTNKPTPLVVGVDGGTESIRAGIFSALDGTVIGTPHSVPYTTSHPKPGYAEQNPQEWYENLGSAVRSALDSLPPSHRREDVVAICLDTTCCSVVALDEDMEPLRPCLLWMDARSAPQAEEIMKKCAGDVALRVNNDGKGPLSAEWLLPKALWLRQNEPEVWNRAVRICEYQDYLNFKLTGVYCASSCNAAARWHWDGVKALNDSKNDDETNDYPGRPLSLYSTLGIPELAGKLPPRTLPMGALVGHLTPAAAEHLSLTPNTPVAQGGPDAYVGMIGLGCIHPGDLCLITGSSHLHCIVSSGPQSAEGIWGAYAGAPLPHLCFAEGGQSSTGSALRWAKSLFGDTISYRILDEEAAAIPLGSEGLLALETFQGSRTPHTDPLARGGFVGLTLSHTRGHVWRALLESIAMGTKACLDALEDAGHVCNVVRMAGGATRSEFWTQMHADVVGKKIVVTENKEAPLLGCAILASVVAGVHGSVEEAVEKMVRVESVVEPREEATRGYEKLFGVYRKFSGSVREVVHDIAKLRGGGGAETTIEESNIVISPSLLASDWCNVEKEIEKCREANTCRIHVDIFDGVFLDSPRALTFGPQMVGAIRNRFSDDVTLDLDVHMCVLKPQRYIEVMKEVGASTFIFQWEAIETLEERLDMVKRIKEVGMRCGISINPETNVEDLFTVLKGGDVDVVDLLAVEPGFGGQKFQESVLRKIEKLREWRHERMAFFGDINEEKLKIMVDGGVNSQTAGKIARAGADILVSGSFLFSHPKGFGAGVKDILRATTTKNKI